MTRKLGTVLMACCLATGMTACSAEPVVTKNASTTGAPASPTNTPQMTNAEMPTTTQAKATQTKSAGSSAPLADANIAVKTQRANEPSKLVVTNVRTGSHEGYDRVVFEMTGDGTPGYFIDYTQSPSQPGSGFPVDVKGDSVLEVNIDGMTYPFELGIEDPKIGHTDGTGSIIDEVVSTGTFEGRTTFFIGVKGRDRAYSVQQLDNPTRLVVDIKS